MPYDEKGEAGMTFEIKYLDTFKNAFDTFKVACCKTCRIIDEIRFKTKDKPIQEAETPKKVNFMV